MKSKVIVSLISMVVLIAVGFTPARSGDEVSVDNMAPVVVKTIPQAGTKDVDPALKTIKVTFSKDMTDKNWSWVIGAPGHFPELRGDPRYLKDKRTCVVDVNLEPGRTYAIWLNSERYKNFKDTKGMPAIPYFLVFETAKK